ncbi:TolC family protein [Pseudomonas sp. SED1]|uniref:TolC family protein n=1 Tax=Pseudomonas sp. SED1 TaxID=3056845 RepID=UPI00296F361D|nr:TolC family protein [Pseudomonas sp. SED1]MDY0836542.1 TolC family protein [Pseudomonas sp. SED1]
MSRHLNPINAGAACSPQAMSSGTTLTLLSVCLSAYLYSTSAHADDEELLMFTRAATPAAAPVVVPTPALVPAPKTVLIAPPVAAPVMVQVPVPVAPTVVATPTPVPTPRAVRTPAPAPTLAPRTAEVQAVFQPVAPSQTPIGRPAVTAIAPAPNASVAPSVVPAPLPGVSAVALAALPERLAARSGTSVAGPSELELREIFFRTVQAAEARSPQMQRTRAEYGAAQADIDEAKGQRWPQLDIGSQTQSAKFGKGKENESGSTAGVNIGITTMVYDWGRTSKTVSMREYLAKAAESGVEAQMESTAFDVVATMIELGKQRIIIDVSQQFENRMNELVKMLAGVVAVDKGRSSELTQAKARLLQARASRDNAERQARDAEINLSKLVGDRPVMIPRTKEWNIRLANLDTLLMGVDDHPTLAQSRATAESAELQAKVVRASSLPQLNWVINKSTSEDTLGREQPWQTSLAVTWGAFRGGSTRAAERAALQRAAASHQDTEQQRLDLEYRIRTANHDARTLLERAELYRDLSVESDRIRKAFYEQWYHLGKRTLLDVLTAENEHYGNQVSEVTSRFDGYQAIFRQYAGAGTLMQWLSGAPR